MPRGHVPEHDQGLHRGAAGWGPVHDCQPRPAEVQPVRPRGAALAIRAAGGPGRGRPYRTSHSRVSQTDPRAAATEHDPSGGIPRPGQQDLDALGKRGAEYQSVHGLFRPGHGPIPGGL